MDKQILGQKGESKTHQSKSQTLIAVRRNRYIPG